jgi:uncharacterized protein
MATDHIRYDILAQAALRGVLQTVLADAAKKGLPGEHHFKISFKTTASGVRLSERMRSQYPEEMTIVLQHQFWDLIVDDEMFEVGLSFGGIPERVGVPFDAVTAFFDPAVQFGFQFEALEADATADVPADAKAPEIPAATGHRARPRLPTELPETGALPAPTAAKPVPAPPEGSGGGEVVRLDRFRKK